MSWSATKACLSAEFLIALLKRLDIRGANLPAGWSHSKCAMFTQRMCTKYAEKRRKQ